MSTAPDSRAYAKVCLAVVALSVVAAGCAQQGPRVEFVEGRVLLEGEPVEGATVSFSPVDPSSGLSAVGMTDVAGVFRLNAVRGGRPQAGTAIGEYRVAIMKIIPDPAARLSATGPQKVIHVVPEPYGDAKTSGLLVAVQKGRNTGESFTFDLRRDFRGDQAQSGVASGALQP